MSEMICNFCQEKIKEIDDVRYYDGFLFHKDCMVKAYKKDTGIKEGKMFERFKKMNEKCDKWERDGGTMVPIKFKEGDK